MKGNQFWIIIGVVAFLCWLGLRFFVQGFAENVTADPGSDPVQDTQTAADP